MLSPGPDYVEAYLGDEDDYYERAAENIREAAQTPPSPRTPSEAETPRSQPAFFDASGPPHTPRTPDDQSQVATPPSDDGSPPRHLSIDERAPMGSIIQFAGAQTTSPPRTGLTTGTMGWTAEVDALITPAGTRTGTRAGTGWASQASYDDMSELGDVTGQSRVPSEQSDCVHARGLTRWKYAQG